MHLLTEPSLAVRPFLGYDEQCAGTNAKQPWSGEVAQILFVVRVLVIGFVVLMIGRQSAAAQQAPRRVLLLYPYDSVSPATLTAGTAIRKRLLEASSLKIDIHSDFLDLARFPSETDQLHSARYLAEKYADNPPEIIMPLSPEAQRFAIKYRGIIAPNVPIVFCCVTPEMAAATDRPGDVTGIYGEFDAGKTIALAQQLQPRARNLVVISGASEMDRQWLSSVRSQIEAYEDHLKTEYWIGLPYDTLLDQVSHLPRETIVLFMTVYGDGTSRSFVPAEVLSALSEVASAPIYGPSDNYLGRGIVGGYTDSYELMGTSAADIALEILAGKSPTTIAPKPSENRSYKVDARQLSRWKIAETTLPERTLVYFKQPTIWEEHRSLVLATIFVILLQAMMIAVLLAQMVARRRAETSLKESEERWRSVFEISTVGVALADQDFRFQVTNAAFQAMLGRTDEELRGLSPLDICAEEEREPLKLLYERVRKGSQESYETVQEYRRADGASVWVQAYVSRMQGNASKPPLFLATTIDITDRRRAEAASRDALSDLARVARLATMGEMTASIAHEINQPLGAIVTDGSAGLRWLAHATPDIEEARACLRRIVKDGHRASQVISGIRTMLKKGRDTKEPLDINELVRDVLTFARGEIENERIVVRTEFKENLSQVLVDRVQLQQVVLNLVMNGIDAMASLRDRARVLELRSEQVGPSRVTLTVEDAGTGIDQNITGRIFEAFFTTKKNGTGMGLSICRSIVAAHGGQLFVSPGDLHGSVFHLELPIYQPGTG
jgi:PAS domain S-box-containing protein